MHRSGVERVEFLEGADRVEASCVKKFWKPSGLFPYSRAERLQKIIHVDPVFLFREFLGGSAQVHRNRHDGRRADEVKSRGTFLTQIFQKDITPHANSYGVDVCKSTTRRMVDDSSKV